MTRIESHDAERNLITSQIISRSILKSNHDIASNAIAKLMHNYYIMQNSLLQTGLFHQNSTKTGRKIFQHVCHVRHRLLVGRSFEGESNSFFVSFPNAIPM
jgi:hypothetical protein